MSAARARGRPIAWVPLLAIGVLSTGLAAGVWKHAGIDMARFCVLYVAGKTVVSVGFWPARGRQHGAGSRPFLAFAALAAVLNGLAWVAYLIAFERGPLAIVQTISAGYSAVATVLAVVFLRERLLGAQAVGVALVVVASMVLCYAGEAPSAGSRGGWLPTSLASAAFWGANAVVAKHAYGLPGADQPRFFAVHGLGLAATVLPYGLWLAAGRAEGARPAGGILPALLVVLLYLAGDLGIYGAMMRGPASIVHPIFGLYAIPSIAYVALVLGDRPGALEWSAIAVASAGVILVLPAADNPLIRLLARHRPRPERPPSTGAEQ
jgi:drug/metabolite transporter (DMT)-like permease